MKKNITPYILNRENRIDKNISNVVGELNNLKTRLKEEDTREISLHLVSVAESGVLYKDSGSIDYNLYNDFDSLKIKTSMKSLLRSISEIMKMNTRPNKVDK